MRPSTAASAAWASSAASSSPSATSSPAEVSSRTAWSSAPGCSPGSARQPPLPRTPSSSPGRELSHAAAARAAAAWLSSLPGDEDGVRGRGGWRADPGEQPGADDHAVLLLTSAGEDVADGLEDAADDAHAALAAVEGLTLRWTPLPRDPSR